MLRFWPTYLYTHSKHISSITVSKKKKTNLKMSWNRLTYLFLINWWHNLTKYFKVHWILISHRSPISWDWELYRTKPCKHDKNVWEIRKNLYIPINHCQAADQIWKIYFVVSEKNCFTNIYWTKRTNTCTNW